MSDNKNYPRWIYPPKEGEDAGKQAFIVKSAYEHAEYYAKGWSGPPVFTDEVSSLEEKIKEYELELGQMKKMLAVLKNDEEKTRVPDPPPPPPPLSNGLAAPKVSLSTGKTGK